MAQTMEQPEIKLNEKPYKWLKEGNDCRFNFLYGGRASSKSWTVAQYLLFEKFLKERCGILTVRQYRPAVKHSCWMLVRDLLGKTSIRYAMNMTELTLSRHTGSFWLFMGGEDVDKLKSIEGINYIWVEEATQFTYKQFLELNLLCRAGNQTGINRVISTFNPIDPIGNAWLKERTDSGDCEFHNSKQQVLRLTHTNNPFLAKAEHDNIEGLADTDEEYNKIYRLGLWATPTNLIYNKWDIVEDMVETYDERIWGLDFGYSSNPSALIEIRIKGSETWEREHIYQTGLTNPQLIELLNEYIDNRTDILVADSAEPKSIQEIRNAGFNIFPCKKGPDSVNFGIKTVRRFKTHICKDSPNLLKEKQGYKWKTDRSDNPLDTPLKFNDHLMDAERYALMKVAGYVKAGLYL